MNLFVKPPSGSFFRICAVALTIFSSFMFATLKIVSGQLICNPNQIITRVSVSSDGTQANAFSNSYTSSLLPSLSADGRYTAFASDASNLVVGDTNNTGDVFVYDRQTCTTMRVSVASDGTQADKASDITDISATGQYMLFRSLATNLVTGAVPNEILLRDQQSGQTSRLSTNRALEAAFSHNGLYIVFRASSNIANGTDLYLYNLQTGQTVPVPLIPGQTPSQSRAPKVSDDGRYIAFESADARFVNNDINNAADIFLKDLVLGEIRQISITSGGQGAEGRSHLPALAADGSVIAFSSTSRLTPDDVNSEIDVYSHDIETGLTVRVSVKSNGEEVVYGSAYSRGHTPDISADGRFILFAGGSSTTNQANVYLHDLETRQTTLMQMRNDTYGIGFSYIGSMSSDAKFVTYGSNVSILVPNDTNNVGDYFVVSVNDLYQGFVVNTTDDLDDGLCNSLHCSLREAISASNVITAENKSIGFQISGTGIHTIQPTSELPQVSPFTIISGRSQSDFTSAPLIELDGSSAGDSANGLALTGNSAIYSLAINGFGNSGIHLAGNTGNNQIAGNYIGFDPDSQSAQGNTKGIWIETSENQLYGYEDFNRNIISGNGDGIVISGSQATENAVFKNYIGVDPTGSVALGNTGSGVLIDNAPSNTVGTTHGGGNVISGNTMGVTITGAGTTDNDISGNLIGLNASGTQALGNSISGVMIQGSASGNTIGGQLSDSGNKIAYNPVGILVQTAIPGNTIIGNQIFANLGAGVGVIDASSSTSIHQNSIYSNGGLGIDLGNDGITPNGSIKAPILTRAIIDPIENGEIAVWGTIEGPPNRTAVAQIYASSSCDPSGYGEGQTFVGTAFSQTNADGTGLLLSTAGRNVPADSYITATVTIGGTSEFSSCIQAVTGQTGPTYIVNNTGDRNESCQPESCSLREAILASNNDFMSSDIRFKIPGSGVQTIRPNSPLPPITEQVTIDGTTQAGTAGGPVIELDGSNAGTNADGLVIRGDRSSIRFIVVNGFSAHGIVVEAGVTIERSYIGTDVTGTIAKGNGSGGVNEGGIWVKVESNRVFIGSSSYSNVISGNNPNGLILSGAYSSVTRNLIGVNALGNAALPNGVGIKIDGHDHHIGKSDSSLPGNIISGNSTAGIQLEGERNWVNYNFIGTDRTRTLMLGNQGAGIEISGVSNVVGANTVSMGNTIAFNQGAGVSVIGDTSLANVILSNKIFANGGLGIDLGDDGFTLNDLLDVDTGPNQLQNTPTLFAAQVSGQAVTVRGTLNSTPETYFWLQLFAGPTCDPSGYGEGENFLYQIALQTDATGNLTFALSFTANVPVGWYVTSISSVNGNTSEFSKCVRATLPPPSSPSGAAPDINFFTTSQPILTWLPVSWATNYHIQIASDDQFSNIVREDDTILANQLSWIPQPLSNGYYFWRIRAKKPDGNWGDWSSSSFQISIP